ncbi:thiamine pyrophosphate-binding protein [Pusillimonas noertemannii]|uniref:thiamine pyrophosphate-binding protein n=1 Tax=Pusillimonas noertemannii TaxID=305977 RepID=UPI0033409337
MSTTATKDVHDESTISGGEVVARFLEANGVGAAFGVISIHNLPILDAIGTRGLIRFVPSRGEAGAINMADAYSRVKGQLGVAFTSTGTGSGNAAGTMIEALTAGSPVLHITGQVDTPYLDRECGFIHETRDQPGMLKAISKATLRAWSTGEIAGVLKKAAQIALTPPMGPVSVEIPIDVQQGHTKIPTNLHIQSLSLPRVPASEIDQLVQIVGKARRPLLWLGGGARHAGDAVKRLLKIGFCCVTSVNGRGIVAEDHPQTLGALQMQKASEDLYKSCDAMIVVGSRLRAAETRGYTLHLPKPLAIVDADPSLDHRSYKSDCFITGDAHDVLSALADRLESSYQTGDDFLSDVAHAKQAATAEASAQLGVYGEIMQYLRQELPKNSVWVRDVTLANSIWGNRLFKIYNARQGVHALGGGIGQGLAMAIGAATACSSNEKTAVLCGDGGLMLGIGELATLAQENLNVILLIMNDRGYGVIRNIQTDRFEKRHFYTNLSTPNLANIAKEMGLAAERIETLQQFRTTLDKAMSQEGPFVIEVDMEALGPYPAMFAGPPVGVRVSSR